MRKSKFALMFAVMVALLGASLHALAAKEPAQADVMESTSHLAVEPFGEEQVSQESSSESCTGCQSTPSATPTPAADLQPGVEEFIGDSYLGHKTEFPDPNEPADLLRLSLEGRELLKNGETDEAVTLFYSAVSDYPNCRHAHAGLGMALWQRHQENQKKEDLQSAVQAFITADEIGIKYGRVHYTYQIAVGLGQLGDRATLDSFFEQALKDGNEPYLARLHYAQGLSLLGDERAEKWYQMAMDVEPEGIADAVAYYAEWLLDHERDADVVTLVSKDARLEYAHFLKGVALERLGLPEEARQEYERYQEMSESFPAPARYRIEGSEAQAGLVFEGDTLLLATQSEALQALSRAISGEAQGESSGGQIAVGWTVRTRVFRAYYVSTSCGGYPGGAWGALPPGSTLPDKYVGICIAPAQFNDLPPTPSTDQAAQYVWNGTVPDPVTQACISGYNMTGDWCNGLCSSTSTQGAFTHGPAWIRSDKYGPCYDYHPSSSCSLYKLQPCPNPTPNNCFYRIR